MTELCSHCKKTVEQCLPLNRPYPMACWGCCKFEGFCETSDICMYVLDRLREEGLLNEPPAPRPELYEKAFEYRIKYGIWPPNQPINELNYKEYVIRNTEHD